MYTSEKVVYKLKRLNVVGLIYSNLNFRYVNELQSNGSNINVMYSTPSCYVDALHSENLTWPTNLYDFFPYAGSPHAYFTGYFTSRPTLKGFERQANNVLQVCISASLSKSFFPF